MIGVDAEVLKSKNEVKCFLLFDLPGRHRDVSVCNHQNSGAESCHIGIDAIGAIERASRRKRNRRAQILAHLNKTDKMNTHNVSFHFTWLDCHVGLLMYVAKPPPVVQP